MEIATPPRLRRDRFREKAYRTAVQRIRNHFIEARVQVPVIVVAI